MSYISLSLLLEMIFLDFLLDDLIADVPIGVVIPGVSAWINDWILVFWNWMIGKSKLDLHLWEMIL